MKLRAVKQGTWPIYALATDRGDCQLLDFLSALTGPDEKVRRKFFALMQHVAEQGPRQLPVDICHAIASDEGVYQFRVKDLRIVWFYDQVRRQVIICTHAFRKDSKKTPKQEIAYAIAKCKEYSAFIAMGSNLEIIDE